MRNIFHYNANFIPLKIRNKNPEDFRDELYKIPYLLYEVEQLKNGDKIVLNKPGGKRNFGRLSRDDFMVFLYQISTEKLWLISHNEISDDIADKYEDDPSSAIALIRGLYLVCCGEEPDDVIMSIRLKDTVGMPVDAILKLYKWIWGQEDCNYPTKQGRWLSMNGILERFNVSIEDIENG